MKQSYTTSLDEIKKSYEVILASHKAENDRIYDFIKWIFAPLGGGSFLFNGLASRSRGKEKQPEQAETCGL